MKKAVAWALFVLAAPILALLVSFLCENKLNVELRRAVLEANPGVTREQLQAVTVRRLLADREDSELSSVRTQVLHFDLMRAASLAMIGLVLVYAGALWAAGKLAVRDRTLLLRIFKPGYYASSALLAATTVVNAALLIAAIYYGESYLLGVYHPKILFLLGAGALLGSWAIIRSALASRQRASVEVFGQALTETGHPRIWSAVRGLANGIGSLAPDHIVLGLDPTFFVTESDVCVREGRLTGRTMFLSAPLTRLLEAKQFEAVVSHELGHFKGQDTEFSQKFYPVYQGLISSLAGLAGMQGWMAYAVMPSSMMLGTFLTSFAAAEAKLGRERELAADAVAVGATDARAFAVALGRIIVASSYWEKMDKELAGLASGGRELVNVSRFAAAQALADVAPEVLAEMGSGKMVHPTDSHPPAGLRLEAIGTSFDLIKEEILAPPSGPPAIDLIDGVDAVEEELSAAYRDRLARTYYLDAPETA